MKRQLERTADETRRHHARLERQTHDLALEQLRVELDRLREEGKNQEAEELELQLQKLQAEIEAREYRRARENDGLQ